MVEVQSKEIRMCKAIDARYKVAAQWTQQGKKTPDDSTARALGPPWDRGFLTVRMYL